MINTKHIKNSFERAFNENITILEEKPDLIKVRGLLEIFILSGKQKIKKYAPVPALTSFSEG